MEMYEVMEYVWRWQLEQILTIKHCIVTIVASSSSFFAIRWSGANRPALMAGYLLGNQARPGEGRGGVWTMQVDR